MVLALSDTHALLWYAFNDARLSDAAGRLMDDAEASGDQVGISAISLVEIVYLIEKRRIPAESLDRVRSLFDQGGMLREVVVDRGVATSLARVPRSEVPDMPDRIIAATALHLGVPLISRDGKIRASSVRTIW